jgi:hypothetical protein
MLDIGTAVRFNSTIKEEQLVLAQEGTFGKVFALHPNGNLCVETEHGLFVDIKPTTVDICG